MRILIFNWRDWKHPRAGGAEIYTHEVADQWVRAGHVVTIFCAKAPGLPDVDIAGGVSIIRRGNPWTVYREARKFYKNEARGKYDLVVDEVNTRPFLTPRFVDDAPVVALIHQVAKEVWSHETPMPIGILGRYHFESRWLKEYANVRTITVSESSRASLLEYGLNDVTVLPEGFTPPPIEVDGKKETVPTVVFCGRMAPNKRPHHALEAFDVLRTHIPDAQMWMIGEGKMLPQLRKRACDAVSFFGRVSHVEKFEMMSRAHVLVATSVREGWGLVVTEAAAVGTPTIGYDVPGLRDSVPSARGVLVNPDPYSLGVMLGKELPNLFNGQGRQPVPGGVVSWSEVARGILNVATAETAKARSRA